MGGPRPLAGASLAVRAAACGAGLALALAAGGVGAALLLPACTGRDFVRSPLDWSGGQFLALYAVLLGVPLLIGNWLRDRAFAACDRDDATALLEDPREVAMLSGGPRRVVETTVAQLAASGALALVRTKAGVLRLKASGDGTNADDPLAQAVLKPCRNQQGAPVSRVLRLKADVRAIEARLAALGLRPGKGDRKRAAGLFWKPLVLLLVFGAVRVVVGAGSDQSVGFLMLLMVVTLVIGITTAGSLPRLSASGVRWLERRRGEWFRERKPMATPEDVAMAVALIGPSALAGVAGLEPLATELHAAAAAAGPPNDAGGSDGGCGSADSGASGCGGCGGD